MKFPYDLTGVKEGRKVEPLPEGVYNLRIVTAEGGTTKAGKPKVTVDYEVYDGDYMGRSLKYHTVTFFGKDEKGAGITKGYLSAIGEPNDGSVEVDTDKWIGKVITAKVGIKLPDEKGRIFNEVKWVNKYEIDFTKPSLVAEVATGTAVSEEEVPF
jgi:hypothetical protein